MPISCDQTLVTPLSVLFKFILVTEKLSSLEVCFNFTSW